MLRARARASASLHAHMAARVCAHECASVDPRVRASADPCMRAHAHARVRSRARTGGWTTTFAGGLDDRISLSMPVAGSLPCDFHHTSWDYEQLCNMKWAMVANYTSLYVFGGLEPGRTMVQINHEQARPRLLSRHRRAATAMPSLPRRRSACRTHRSRLSPALPAHDPPPRRTRAASTAATGTTASVSTTPS